MKTLLILIMMTMTGCGVLKQMGAKITGQGFETCLDGVLYYQFANGSSVAYNKDGSIQTCNEKDYGDDD